jgi:pimeloyl-[acyl-carrier protein] methyl ester esterase
MKIAMRDGCKIHVESEGGGDTAIVFLHGIMMSGAVFKRQVAALSGEYRVVTIDVRGFGQSDRPESGYSGEVFVDDLKYILDRLELKRPVIAGWSMGGAIAMAFAAQFPGTASRLVLIGTTPCLVQRPDWPHAVPPEAAAQLGQMLATDYAAGVEMFCRMMFPEPNSDDDMNFIRGIMQMLATDYAAGVEVFCRMMFPEPNSDDDMNFIRGIMLASSPQVTLACMQNLGGSDLRPLLGAVRDPVDVLCGDADAVCPPGASAYLADTLGGKLTLLPGGGHCAFLTKSDEFNRALRAGLARRP